MTKERSEFAWCNLSLDNVTDGVTLGDMIKSFCHKGLMTLFLTGRSAKVRRELHARIRRRLDVMDAADDLPSLNVPGFNFHALEGKPRRYSIHVNGPYCLTFEMSDGDVYRVNLENYH